MFLFNRKGVYASVGGGHCQKLSHVLVACGIDETLAQCALSFSLSFETKEEEIDYAIETIVLQHKNYKHLVITSWRTMSHRKFTPSLPWARYSKKLVQKIENPRHGGFFSDEEAKERGMRLSLANKEFLKMGMSLPFIFSSMRVMGSLPMRNSRCLAHQHSLEPLKPLARFSFGRITIRRCRLTADLIDKQVRDKNGITAFPEETFAYLNLVIDAIEQAAEQCVDIPLDETYVSTPLETKGENGEGYPGWNLLIGNKK